MVVILQQTLWKVLDTFLKQNYTYDSKFTEILDNQGVDILSLAHVMACA